MKDAEIAELTAKIKRSPQGIQRANSLLLVAALLMLAHRIYYAHAHEIALWKGLLVGLFLALLSFHAGTMIFQKKRWVYWGVLSISATVGFYSTIHCLAEVLRFV